MEDAPAEATFAATKVPPSNVPACEGRLRIYRCHRIHSWILSYQVSARPSQFCSQACDWRNSAIIPEGGRPLWGFGLCCMVMPSFPADALCKAFNADQDDAGPEYLSSLPRFRSCSRLSSPKRAVRGTPRNMRGCRICGQTQRAPSGLQPPNL